MGIDVGDFDNDRPFDLVVTNCAHDYDTLYRNLGGSFVDHSFVAGSRSRRSLLSAGVSISWTWITTWTSISSCPMDIVVSNQDARPTYLVNETEGAGHSILVELIDTPGHAPSAGSAPRSACRGTPSVHTLGVCHYGSRIMFSVPKRHAAKFGAPFSAVCCAALACSRARAIFECRAVSLQPTTVAPPRCGAEPTPALPAPVGLLPTLARASYLR